MSPLGIYISFFRSASFLSKLLIVIGSRTVLYSDIYIYI